MPRGGYLFKDILYLDFVVLNIVDFTIQLVCKGLVLKLLLIAFLCASWKNYSSK